MRRSALLILYLPCVHTPVAICRPRHHINVHISIIRTFTTLTLHNLPSPQVGDLDAESREGLSQLYAADFDLLNYSRTIRGRGAHRGGTVGAAEGSGEEADREEGLRLSEDEVVVVARD
jgi:hypothetical protein